MKHVEDQDDLRSVEQMYQTEYHIVLYQVCLNPLVEQKLQPLVIVKDLEELVSDYQKLVRQDEA
jgi:hypothetical protein